jgi:hypothetical protein
MRSSRRLAGSLDVGSSLLRMPDYENSVGIQAIPLDLHIFSRAQPQHLGDDIPEVFDAE